jgi:exodeoxyribonuclease VII small subunit
MTFEDAMERLEEIVSAMEADRLPLEEMVTAYAEGGELLKICKARIESARQRVELITTRLDEPAALSPFDPADAAASASEPARATPARSAPSPRKTPSKPSSATDSEDIRLF